MANTKHSLKILLTGSHGYLGGLFAELLERKHIPYVAYDRAHPERIPPDVDAVVHFAGIVPHTATSGATLATYEKANVATTERLLMALKSHTKIKRFINIGSAAEYGLSRIPLTEKSLEHPAGPYGESKLEQSHLVEQFARETGIQTINLRIFNIMGRTPQGTGRRPSIFDGLVAQFDAGPKGTVVVEHSKSTRDYVDVSDVMDAIYAALTTKKGNAYEILNIGSGHATPISEIASLVGDFLLKHFMLKNSSARPTHSIANVAKARRLLGWHAHTSVRESIRKLLATRSRVIIVGAGEATHQVLDEIHREKRSDITIVGLVDDDSHKQGKEIRGVPVVGTVDDLPLLIVEREVTQVLISIPSVGKSIALRVAKLLPSGFPIKVLPSASSILLNHVNLSLVRSIDPSDLVGRPIVKADQAFIAKKAKGKTFLVTGAAGSIGSEIVRQLMSFPVKRVIAVDSWEEGVFHLLEEWGNRNKNHSGAPAFEAYIGNVRDRRRIDEILARHHIDTILHAAAYKHVPLMESNPDEARKTNIGGTKNVLEAAVKWGVNNFVLISTDKAVHPASVMGKTKRAAELLVRRYARKYPQHRFITVRFGNVLNSSGSVLPTFTRQIQNRLPVTITHKDMTRYFMSIPEAVSLVLMANVIGKNGQVLVLDMGEPVKILDLALQLIRMHGMEPYTDVPIVEIGIRPGEKIHEELAYDPTQLLPSAAARIFIAEEL